MKCSVENCLRPHAAKGYCHLHYNRWKRHNDPLEVAFLMPRNQTLAERLDMILNRNADEGAVIIEDGARA